jgi:hypothetical protein
VGERRRLPLSSTSYIEEEQTTQRKSTKGQTTYLGVRISISNKMFKKINEIIDANMDTVKNN